MGSWIDSVGITLADGQAERENFADQVVDASVTADKLIVANCKKKRKKLQVKMIKLVFGNRLCVLLLTVFSIATVEADLDYVSDSNYTNGYCRVLIELRTSFRKSRPGNERDVVKQKIRSELFNYWIQVKKFGGGRHRLSEELLVQLISCIGFDYLEDDVYIMPKPEVGFKYIFESHAQSKDRLPIETVEQAKHVWSQFLVFWREMAAAKQ